MGAAAERAFDLAEAGQATIYVPVFTLAEILYLSERKRIQTSLPEVTKYIARFPNLIEQPLNSTVLEVAAQITDIPELHDRIIAATARFLNRPLLTNDNKIRASSFVETIWD